MYSNFFHSVLFMGLLSLITSCSDDGGSNTEVADLITAGSILDVDNTNSPADALVTFSLSDIRLANQVALVVIPSSGFSGVNAVDIGTISASSMQAVSASRLNFKIKLRDTLTDINGSSIRNGIDYTLVFITTTDGVSQINKASKTFTLSDRNVLIGKYSGTWNDNLYTDFGISAILEETGTTISGPFYYSQSFSSCCGGNDDGSIRVISEGDVISSFTYSQTLLSFNGGPCDGLYTGTGSIERDQEGISFLVDFEGDDCEGSHDGGKIRLARIE